MRHPSILLAGILAATSVSATAQQPGLTAETWTGLTPGKSILILRSEGISTRAPNTTQTLAEAKITGLPANSGTRLRGTLTPTVDDTFTFWVNGTDNVALWISEDGTPFTKRLIASHLGATTQTEWHKHPDQKSQPIALTAGVTYHIEAHVMTRVANGHLAIAWQGSKGNWALAANGATATQSTTQWSAHAARAIDGNTSGSWSKGEPTLTANQQNSWLNVDFGATRPVNQIVLHNNAQNQNRLSNFRLTAHDSTGTVLAQQDFFTTSGNVANSFTWDLPATVQAASIKIQLLGLNRAGNGHLSLAEIQAYGPGPYEATRHFQIIPSTFLTTVTTNPADTNDNHLPDAWEQQTGLATSPLPGALLEFGDPDNDGLTNYEEHLFGSDPLAAEWMADGIIRSMWMDETSGSNVASFVRNRARFLNFPSDTTFLSNIDTLPTYLNLGARYRGTLTAPATGTYRFWISSSGDSELWLADGRVQHPATGQPLTDRFGKQRVATSGHVTPVRDYDYNSSQRSRAIHLTAGQTYYLEVLQKIAQGKNHHLSVAWQPPGQPRAIIPAAAFTANAPDPLDADDDNLPDAWETAVGLNPANNGRTSPADGEYGDPDNDGLTNLQEFQYGTNPFSADTDGDGLSDSQEILHYGTNPLDSNTLAPVTLALPPLHQYSDSTTGWTANTDGTLTAWERRGSITHTFEVTQPGVHEIVITASAISHQPWFTKTLHITLGLNGDPAFATGAIASPHGHPGTFRAITPWLPAGQHTLTLHHENVLTELRLRLHHIAIHRLGGQDLDENHIPDWIEQNEATANRLTRIPTHSRTSPATIEGITRQLSTATLHGSAGVPPASSVALELTPSINRTFFTDIPLDEAAPVTLTASFLGGLVTATHSIEWIPTNLLEFDGQTLHIRKDDALRLHAAVEGASGSFIIQSSPVEGASGSFTTEPTSSNTPHTHTFTTPGLHTLTATFTPDENSPLPLGEGQGEGAQLTAAVTLHVHTADLGPAHPVRTHHTRAWTPPVLGPLVQLDPDDQLILSETPTASGPRTFNVRTAQPADHPILARLPETLQGAPGAILARATIHGFDTAQIDRTRDAQIVTRYPDGTWLMRSTIVALNLPEGVVIRLTLSNQGTLFTNGSNILELRTDDFDANGIATIYYEYTGPTAPKLCHNVQVLFQP